jgi:selenide,water dikinase
VGSLEIKSHPDLIVGLDSPDDAGVYKLNNETALIQTLDFLTPVTDSPYEFGQIAAANSLSDVYAMGGRPLTVMNIVCFPSCDMEEEILKQTLEGGIDKINESGATLVGGHSVDDLEFKYGLSVTGVVNPDRVLTNCGAACNDAIILTKPVGTGVMSTAVKAGLASDDDIKDSVAVMSMLNKYAAQVMADFKVSACTDVTGFGLAGHLLEMAKGSGRQVTLDTSVVPVLNHVLEFAAMGMVPAGAHKNRKFFDRFTVIDPGVDRALADLMFDPQTSGGLLICIGRKDAQACVDAMNNAGISAVIIGEVSGETSTGFLRIV